MQTPKFNISDLAPWIEYAFSRSSGPGGQNVNKVSTRVELRFDFEQCALLSDEQRARLRGRCRSRLSSDGRLMIACQEERSQARNRAAADERLLDVLAAALAVRKRRRASAPTRGSIERRLQRKRQQSGVKQMRRSPRRDQD